MIRKLFGIQGIVPIPALIPDEANYYFDIEVKKMPEKKYVLTETQLLGLLEDRAVLQCLDWDGVDNWSWYMTSRNDFISSALEITLEEVSEKDLGFQDVAKKNLEKYPTL